MQTQVLCLHDQAQDSPTESRYAPSEVSTSPTEDDIASADAVEFADAHGARAASHASASTSAAASRQPPVLRLSNIGLNSYFRPPLRQSASAAASAASGSSASLQQQQQQQQQSSQRRALSGRAGGAAGQQHRRGGSWAGSTPDSLQGLVDTVRLIRHQLLGTASPWGV